MIGKEVLNYVIISTIGKGGMGSVYLAEHKYIKQQKVAIKVINNGMVNDFTRNLLKKEAELLASLNHPNIVHFHDYHIDESGNIYLIMEYADGVNLEEYIRSISGLIVEDKICPMFEPILDAVGYAHAHNMIHRDIKPANIIITKEGIPKILDFGIAKIISQRESEDDNLIMGTPSYMSPEQVKGEKLDGRSDIYSLGVLLHQMMTGNPPYDTTTIPERDINRKVVEEPLPRMRSYYKFVSEKVQKVVDKATAKNRNDRYQTCAEFKKALHHAIYPDPIPKWGWISAAVVALLMIGSGLFYWDYNREKVYYYKDYVEQWGVPKGIHELSRSEMKHRERSYRFISKRKKVRSVQLVNSKGYVITDGESEHRDRGVNMQIEYKGDKVDAIIYMSPANTPLYRKEFKNEYIIFTYDENGKERFLPRALSDCYVRLEDEGAEKGKISRYKVAYNPNGYIQSIHYSNRDNRPIGDKYAIYGKEFRYDEKGRVIEERFLGVNDSLKALPWGLAYKTKEYDEQDNWVFTSYFDIEGNPAMDVKDGIYKYSFEHDSYGNISALYYYNPEGELMIPKLEAMSGAAGLKFEHDPNGYRIKGTYLGLDKKPTPSRNGVTTLTWEYDDYGYLSKQYSYDNESQLIPDNSTGSCIYSLKNDSVGNIMEFRYLNRNGELVMTPFGYAMYQCTYDSLGFQTEVSYYDETEQLSCVNNIAIERFMYDNQHRLVYNAFFDENKNPCKNSFGVFCIKWEYNDLGQRTELSYYNEDGNTLMKSNEGFAIWVSEYDEQNNKIKDLLYDEQKKLSPTLLGYTIETFKYDALGNLLQNRYYDENSNPIAVNNIGGYNKEYDNRGNIVKEYAVGINNKPLLNGFIETSQYDSQNNIIAIAYWNCNENPVIEPSKGYHKTEIEYNTKNQMIEQRAYAVDGSLMNFQGKGYAIMRLGYDLYGNIIDESYYDQTNKPAKDEHGIHHYKNEYDHLQRIIRKLRFDEKGNITSAVYGAAETVFEYDIKGNETCRAFFDEKGNRVTLIDGWSFYRSTYDEKGNQTSIAYFDKNEKPVLVHNGKYHLQCYKYDILGNRIEEAYYGTEKEPINIAAGFHKVIYTFKKGGENDSAKTYDAAGKLIASYIWDGSQWVSENTPSSSSSSGTANWQQNIRSLSKELPMDLGEEQDHLVMLSCTVTGANSCEIVFKASKSKYNGLQDSQIEGYIKGIALVVDKFKAEYLPSNVRMTGILKDSRDRTLKTITK